MVPSTCPPLVSPFYNVFPPTLFNVPLLNQKGGLKQCLGLDLIEYRLKLSRPSPNPSPVPIPGSQQLLQS